MSKNPLSELEELFLNEIIPYENDKLRFITSKEAKKLTLKPENMQDAVDDFLQKGPPIKEELPEWVIEKDNETIARLRQLCNKAIMKIQAHSLKISSKELIPYLNHQLNSISYYKNIIENSKENYSSVMDSLLFLEETIKTRYINQNMVEQQVDSDTRIRLDVDKSEIQSFFNRLLEIGVISKDDLNLFLHSNFYGFEPKMEIKEKIEVKTTHANLRYFIYRFKEDNRLFDISQMKFVEVLHNSFACFDNVEESTTYKKMGQKPAKFDLL